MQVKRKVASLYAEITADPKQAQAGLAAVKASAQQTKAGLDQLGKSSKTAGGGAKELGASLSAMAGTLTNVTAAAGAVALALNQAFEFGRHGAAVVQTAESFEMLVRQVGGSADLLEELRTVSRGTIDDMSLMSATATLLAGTQGRLGKELADNAPRILEIASAAAKLNPALGDAKFLYESLMTGIKRGSPMLIDNTGITLKLGEANEKMAASLGKSVEALTSDEQKLAILFATLQAGDVMMQQVGGTAASLTDPFDRWNASVKNLGDSLAETFMPLLADAALGAEELLHLGDNFDKINEILASGSSTYQEYYDRLEEIKWSYGALGFLIPQVSVAEWEHMRAMAATAARQAEVQQQNEQLVEQHQRRIKLLGEEGRLAEEASVQTVNATREIVAGWREVEDGAQAARDAVDDFYSAIKTNAASEIQRQIEALEFRAAGGMQLDAVGQAINQAMLSHTITEEQAKEYLGALYVAAQDLQVELGQITADEAAKNISETMNVSLAEAKKLLDEITSRADYLNGLTANLKVNVEVSGAGAGLISGGTTNVLGNAPAIPRERGGDMYAGRLYMAGEKGAELIVPRQNAHVFNADDTRAIMNNLTYSIGTMQVNSQSADPQQVASAVISKLDTMARNARRAGVQYAGA